MLMKVCLVFAIGCVSEANAENPFCSDGLCFIRPETSGKSWMDAQQICKSNNSTLPIADNANHQKSFVDALSYFQLSGKDVWLGANASADDANNWHWLDGSQYTGTGNVHERGEYYKSYAYVAKKSPDVLAYASAPNVSYSYICQCNFVYPDICTNGTAGQTAYSNERLCYVKYDEKLPWFSARNKCFEKNCDLASFTQLSLLGGMVDSNGSWVGLRHSQWNWTNALTGLSFDVTLTSWRIGQPNDAVADCLATDSTDFPNWKDIGCSNGYPFICQVNYTTNTPPIPGSSTSIPSSSPSITSATTTTSTTTTTSLLGTPETSKSSTSASSSWPTPLPSSTTKPSESFSINANNKNSTAVNIALAIGLGVGLGVPFIILIVVVIVVVAVVLRRRNRNRGNAKSTKRFVTNDNDINAENGTIQMTDKKKKGKTRSDDSSAQYATVKAGNPDATTNPSSNQGVVYADLQFGQ